MSGTAPGTAVGRLRADARDAGALCRTELRARVRHIRGEPRQLVANAFMLLLFGVGLPLVLVAPALSYGGRLASGPLPAGQSGAILASVAGVGLYLGGAGGFNQNRTGSVGPLVRTSIPPRAVALGRLVSETAQASVLVVPPGVVLLCVVAVGAGSPLPALALALASLPVLVASLLAGRVLGDAVRFVSRTVGLSLWAKALGFFAVTTVFYVGTQRLIESRVGDSEELRSFSIPPLLPGEPLQAYAVAVFDPLGAAGHPLGLLVGLVVLASVPVTLAVALRVEAGLLGLESGGSSDERDVASATRGVPRPFTGTPSARVAWRYLLRTRRDPRMLAHLSPLLFGAMAMLASFLTDPESLLLVGPGALVVGGTTLAGAAYCLNPLGDDGDQLPLLLTSTQSVGVLLRGRALAGMIPGLVLAVGIGTPLALFQHGVLAATGQTLLAVALAVSSAGTALGIGALVPKFEQREYMNVERSHPSTIAVLGFFFGGLVVGAVGLVLLFSTLGGGSLPLAAAAWAVYLLVVALPPVAGYVYAVRKFDALTLDDV
jgi:NADH:ubiquinone oxidoreductase subunit K